MECKRCGCYIGEYAGRGRPPKYCVVCAAKIDTIKHLLAEKRVYSSELGTTNMKSKMSRGKDGEPNFKKEQNSVKRELRRLGLRK